jgi:hypothetical protein
MTEARIGACWAHTTWLDEAALSRTVPIRPMPPCDLVPAMGRAAELTCSPLSTMLSGLKRVVRAVGRWAKVFGRDEAVPPEGSLGSPHLTPILEGYPTLVAELPTDPTGHQRHEALGPSRLVPSHDHRHAREDLLRPPSPTVPRTPGVAGDRQRAGAAEHPKVNLLPRRERGIRPPVESDAQVGLVLVVVAIWTTARLAITLLLERHPLEMGGLEGKPPRPLATMRERP